MPIIKSILDNDCYKLTQQKAVIAYQQNVPVEYVFNNRRPEGRFTQEFLDCLEEEIEAMSRLALTKIEAKWLEKTVPFLGHQYTEYLRNYRYDPSEVNIGLKDGELKLKISGPWERTILWEVPLMALISELYFKHCDVDWLYDEEEQRTNLLEKADILQNCKYADFATRRRRDYRTHDLVVGTLKHKKGFVGTSNVHLAHRYRVKPIGTMAHEFMMGISALEGLRFANRHAMKIWSKVFHGRLGVALTDTFGTDAFFRDFDDYLARLFDGVRHDSGDPFEFAEKTIHHYKSLGINPTTKTIVFSDGLNPDKAAEICATLQDRINVSFGIGTNLSNDYINSIALNMVIKMWRCNGVPVVKLGDDIGKQIGERDALRVANWTFFDTPLDETRNYGS